MRVHELYRNYPELLAWPKNRLYVPRLPPKFPHELAKLIQNRRKLEKFVYEHGGQTIILPICRDVGHKIRNRRIVQEYQHGVPVALIAQNYRLHPHHILAIIKNQLENSSTSSR